MWRNYEKRMNRTSKIVQTISNIVQKQPKQAFYCTKLTLFSTNRLMQMRLLNYLCLIIKTTIKNIRNYEIKSFGNVVFALDECR